MKIVDWFRVASIGLCMCFVIGIHESQAEFVPRQFEARRTAVAPVIDGVLEETVWDTAQVIDKFFAYQSGGDPAAANTTARILWDDEFLYVGFEMSDADIRPSSVTARQTGRDAQLYRGDVIELFVREDRTKPRYFEFEWSPQAGDVFDARFDIRKFGPPGTDWDTEMRSGVIVVGTIDDTSDVDTGWVIESAIPLSAFESVGVGSQWTFNVARYDYFNPGNSKEQLMTSILGDPELPQAGFVSGFHTYEIYDDLQFVPEPHASVISLFFLMLLAAFRSSGRR